ncbi:MAG: MlaE family ABC transporter permease [Desulfovibrionaceae bacterium]
MLSYVAMLGRTIRNTYINVGMYCLFTWDILFSASKIRSPHKLLLTQIYFIGARSLFIIILIAFFTGLVLALQGYYTLIRFGSESLLGAAVALTLVRELSPVLAALMLIARAGSAMTAEIAMMRLSHQIDALEVMDINPIHYIIRPKVYATLFSLPLLTGIFSITGIASSYWISINLLGISSGSFISSIERNLTDTDILSSFLKSFVFSLAFSSICTYYGYFVEYREKNTGPVAVSNSTTNAVVISSISIVLTDYIITSFLL